MHILLINPPDTLAVQPPLGLLYIASVLKNSGYEVNIKDCGVEGITFDQLAKLIEGEKPDIVGVTACTPTITQALKVLKTAKSVDSSIKTVIGGPHPSTAPEETIKNGSVDFVLRGEGELAFLELVKSLENKKNLRGVDGLFFKIGKRIIANKPRKLIEDLDSLPWPAREFVPIEKYKSILLPFKTPETSVMGSRGCPFACSFCSKAVFGQRTRLRNYKKVVDEIEYLANRYKIRGIFFYDDSFNFNAKWVSNFCDEIIKRKLNRLTFKAEVRANKKCVSRNLLSKMKKAGFYLLAFGVESGNPNILKNINKAVTLEEVKRAVKLTKEAKIMTYGFFMLGNIGETVDTINDSIKFAIDAGFDFVQFGIAQPYPDTEFFREAKKNNWLKVTEWEDYKEDKKAALVELPTITTEKLREMNKEAIRRFYFRAQYIMQQGARAFSSIDNFKFTLNGLKWVLKAIF